MDIPDGIKLEIKHKYAVYAVTYDLEAFPNYQYNAKWILLQTVDTQG